jgi:hypothetical protein
MPEAVAEQRLAAAELCELNVKYFGVDRSPRLNGLLQLEVMLRLHLQDQDVVYTCGSIKDPICP